MYAMDVAVTVTVATGMDKKELQYGVASWEELKKHLCKLFLGSQCELAANVPMKERHNAVKSGRVDIVVQDSR
jgi:hypothetical protein